MDERRVALAGNNYDISAFSRIGDGGLIQLHLHPLRRGEVDEKTPHQRLGDLVSGGGGHGIAHHPAKLFRSGALTVLDLLMMNGYTSSDLVGRTGRTLSVTVDGQRLTFRGQSATP